MPTHFTEIAVGAAANADTFNDPFNELDAALTAEAAARAAADTTLDTALDAETAARNAGDNLLDARIDNIIADSETSSAETVDARAAGNVSAPATTLAERLEWLEGAQNVHAAAYGFAEAGSAAANATSINAATAAAASFGTPAIVHLPAGRFTVNNFALPEEVVLCGARMPIYDSGSSNLEGGTVISGATVTLDNRSGLMNLGVQVASAKNCISAGNSNDCILLNVATKGDGSNHGCSFTSGARNFVNNFRAHFHDHGLVFKGSYNIASNLYFFDMAISCMTLTSDAGAPCQFNVISNLISTAAAAGDAGPFRIHGIDYDIGYNRIANFVIENAARGFLLQYREAGPALVKYNVIGPGIIRDCTFAGIDIQEGADDVTPGTGCDYNTIIGVTIVDAGTYSFSNADAPGALNNLIVGCQSFSPASGHVSGTWGSYGINGGHGNLIVEQSLDGGDVFSTIRNNFTSAASVDELTSLRFQFANTTGDAKSGGRITVGKVEDYATLGAQSAYMAFSVAGDGTLTEAMRIDKAGNVGIRESVPESTLHVNGALSLAEIAADPTGPASANRGRLYVKNDKLVVQYYDGGVRYKTLALTSGTVTWVDGTSAP